MMLTWRPEGNEVNEYPHIAKNWYNQPQDMLFEFGNDRSLIHFKFDSGKSKSSEPQFDPLKIKPGDQAVINKIEYLILGKIEPPRNPENHQPVALIAQNRTIDAFDPDTPLNESYATAIFIFISTNTKPTVIGFGNNLFTTQEIMSAYDAEHNINFISRLQSAVQNLTVKQRSDYPRLPHPR